MGVVQGGQRADSGNVREEAALHKFQSLAGFPLDDGRSGLQGPRGWARGDKSTRVHKVVDRRGAWSRPIKHGWGECWHYHPTFAAAVALHSRFAICLPSGADS